MSAVMGKVTSPVTSPDTRPDRKRDSFPWISSARFDLALFFGAALLGLAAPLLVLSHVVSPIVVVWIYVAFFDGPHMMAGYTRTYFDRESMKRAPLFFWGALIGALLVPISALVGSAIIGSEGPFLLFLSVMSLYSYWHIVRQGWGIYALYRSRQGARANIRRERATFYFSMYAPYSYFMFTHPAVRDAVGAPHLAHAWERNVAWGLIAIGVLAFASLIRELLRAKSRAALAFASVTIGYHALLYLALATFEPMFGDARGPDQSFMIITAAVSVAHATQYVALVGLHNRRRYGAVDVHGLAARIAKTAPRYIATCLAFSLLYVMLTCASGIYPGCVHFFGGSSPALATPHITLARVALGVYWGIALQHYVIDARIWRIKSDPELRRVLFGASATPSQAPEA